MREFLVSLDILYKDHKGKYIWKDFMSKLWLRTISKRISDYGYLLGFKIKNWIYKFNENKLYVELLSEDDTIPFGIDGGEVYR